MPSLNVAGAQFNTWSDQDNLGAGVRLTFTANYVLTYFTVEDTDQEFERVHHDGTSWISTTSLDQIAVTSGFYCAGIGSTVGSFWSIENNDAGAKAYYVGGYYWG